MSVSASWPWASAGPDGTDYNTVAKTASVDASRPAGQRNGLGAAMVEEIAHALNGQFQQARKCQLEQVNLALTAERA